MFNLSSVPVWFAQNWRWLLVLSCLPLFAHKTAFNLPFGIMMVAGIIAAVRRPRALWDDSAVRILSAIFLCFEIPMLLSLFDAVDFGRATETAAIDFRFWFAGIFIIETLRNPLARARLLAGAGVVLAYWSVDGMVQYVLGRNLFGFGYNGTQLCGVFCPKLRLGTVTATMLPLLLEWVRRYGARYRWLVLLVPAALAIILLSGSRTAWVMLATALGAYGFYLFFVVPRRWRMVLIGGIAASVALATALAFMHAPLRDRLAQTAGLFGDYEAANKATSMRLPLWRTGWRMFQDHWINGVGPRGYRYVYEDYAPDNNYWILRMEETGQEYPQTHPHSQLLEVAAETGAIGLAGLLLMWVVMIKGLRNVSPIARSQVMPWVLASLVAWSPLNVHMALYGSYWSSVAWWVLLVAIAMMSSKDAAPAPRWEPAEANRR